MIIIFFGGIDKLDRNNIQNEYYLNTYTFNLSGKEIVKKSGRYTPPPPQSNWLILIWHLFFQFTFQHFSLNSNSSLTLFDDF